MEKDKKISKTLDPSVGRLLKGYLALLGLMNLLLALAILLNHDALAKPLQQAHISIFYILGVLSLINVALLFGVHLWKKYCIYGVYLVTTIIIIITVSIGIEFLDAAKGFIGLVILFLVTWDYREKFS